MLRSSLIYYGDLKRWARQARADFFWMPLWVKEGACFDSDFSFRYPRGTAMKGDSMAISGKKSDAGRVGVELIEAFSQCFEERGWVQLLRVLDQVSEVGERNGRREISIQAQCLRASIECRVRSWDGVAQEWVQGAETGMEGWVDRLKEHLDHLAWTKEVSALPEIV
jgi:hypothetical protein